MSGASVDLRPIHYMGNKSRFLDAIESAVDGVAGPGVAACDLFAGTAVVTRRLARTRPVLSADIQSYSGVLARALTAPTALSQLEVASFVNAAREWLDATRPLLWQLLGFEARALGAASTDPALLAALIDQGSLAVSDGHCGELAVAKGQARELVGPDTATITWHYGGVYFSYSQALEIDALLYACRLTGEGERNDTVVAAILGAASDCVSTVGSHFAQPVQVRRRDGTLKSSWIGSVVRRRDISVLAAFLKWLDRYGALRSTAHACAAIQSDFRDTLADLGSEVGVIYADPPYTRDHYSRFYHVLETIALDDDPGVSQGPGSVASRGLYRADRHQSPFCIRTQAVPAFQHLMAEAERLEIPLVLSYSPRSGGTKARPETRLLTIDQLVSMAKDYFKEVVVLDVAASSHSRFNRAEVSADVPGSAEVLIVGTS